MTETSFGVVFPSGKTFQTSLTAGGTVSIFGTGFVGVSLFSDLSALTSLTSLAISGVRSRYIPL